MFPIVYKENIAPKINLIRVQAPEIAAKVKPGQFVIYRLDEHGERIPLTVADKDLTTGTITLIFQEVGRSTMDLGEQAVGDTILDIVGPLGKPSEIEAFGTVVCIGGGVGIAPLYPITRALHQLGDNRIISILGGRSEEYLILRSEMTAVSESIYLATDDGSAGIKGFVTDVLRNLIEQPTSIDLVIAIGPVPMMEAVSAMTRPHQIKTVVSMNTIMVDGTGMCGACRLQVGDATRFACVDGPDFDGHLVNWEIARVRARTFLQQEKVATETKCQPGGNCQCQI